MPRLELRPFADEDLDAAAALLGERHRRHREAEPLLPSDVDFAAEIQGLRDRDGASGAAALRDGRLVGYLIATRLSDETWGPNVWVEPAGHAVQEPEDVRDLYAFAAAEWVADGRRAHFVQVPATDAELVDAWFRLGFGGQQAHGIREAPAEDLPTPEVREADERDLDALLELAPTLSAHQTASPVFSGRPPPDDLEEWREDILDDLGREDVVNFVVERDGRIVGNFVGAPVELTSMHAGLARPPGAAYLAYAATLPDVRGSGAGVALTNAILMWARDRGHETIVTDWRVTNLLSSRFWPRRGFRTSFLRLHRLLP